MNLVQQNAELRAELIEVKAKLEKLENQKSPDNLLDRIEELETVISRVTYAITNGKLSKVYSAETIIQEHEQACTDAVERETKDLNDDLEQLRQERDGLIESNKAKHQESIKWYNEYVSLEEKLQFCKGQLDKYDIQLTEIRNVLTEAGIPQLTGDDMPGRAITVVDRVKLLFKEKLEAREELKTLITNNEALAARETDLLDQLYTVNNSYERYKAQTKKLTEREAKNNDVDDRLVTAERLIDDAIDLMFEGSRRDVYEKLLQALQTVSTLHV